jgi:Zn-dependent M28 family amino/carboxypeptidase
VAYCAFSAAWKPRAKLRAAGWNDVALFGGAHQKWFATFLRLPHGMIALETMGYYSDADGSQHYPWPFSLLYPSRGDFIGFVGNLASRRLVRQVVGTFRQGARFPSEGAAVPAVIPDAGRSDHSSFWQEGYAALMVTDTAPFRYPFYHTPQDTADKLDFDRLARVAVGLELTLRDLSD